MGGSEAQRGKVSCPASQSLWMWLPPHHTRIGITGRHNEKQDQWFADFPQPQPFITISARQPISSPFQRYGSLPSPGWELQKCRYLVILISGTRLGKSRHLGKDGQKDRNFQVFPDCSPMMRRPQISTKVPCSHASVALSGGNVILATNSVICDY